MAEKKVKPRPEDKELDKSSPEEKTDILNIVIVKKS